MAVNAFITFFDKAQGESVQKGKERWVEILGWHWDIEAESSWTKGGGASVGKPNPGTFAFEHAFDTASIVIMGYICTGKAFPKVELQLTKPGRGASPVTWFTMSLEGCFVTGVANSGGAEGPVTQRVEMVFKTVRIEYKPEDRATGSFGSASTFNWDIPAGTASPSA